MPKSAKTKAAPGLFDGAAPAYTKPKPPPAWVLNELVNTFGVPRPVVNRFSCRAAFGKLRECQDRAARKAAQPTAQQRRDELLKRLRMCVTDDDAGAEEFYNMVCEGMCEMTEAELKALVVEAALLLFAPAPKSDAALPF